MNALIARAKGAISYLTNRFRSFWGWYRTQKPWKQVAMGIAAAVVLIGGISFLHSLGKVDEGQNELRTVTLASAGSLSGTGDGASVIGTVRSIAEAQILAESGGTVRSVRTQQGAGVPAGFVIAELENASQRATVLQAEGAYDAAVAARNSVSPVDAALGARNTYQSAFSAIEYALENQVDSFYGTPGPYGPNFTLGEGRFSQSYFPSKRAELDRMIDAWRVNLASAASRDPEQLLGEAIATANAANELLSSIAEVTNASGSNASATQVANLASARATISAQASALASAREAYRSKNVGSSASVDASVKQALGSLRGAQAQLEKTLIRAPLAGTVNFLPIRVGDYVTAYTHVATVAQNGALEVVTYVSEDEREQLSAGEKVTINENVPGVITRVAPALDPTTRQIEVHVAVTGDATGLVNGQSVRVQLPNTDVVATGAVAGPLMLPLASVKLRANDRVVFTVDTEGRIVGNPVTIGAVHGDRIEVLSGVSSDMRIVTDARGLAEGEKVRIADTVIAE